MQTLGQIVATMEKNIIPLVMLSVIFAWTLVLAQAQTVPDTTPPVVFNCPQRDNFILTSHGFVFANLKEPSAIDYQSPPVRTERSIAPGFYVDVGFSQNVTYTFTDKAGNRARCSFAVHAVAFVHCQALTCQNGATCIKDQVLDENHLCICPVGHYGQLCENIDNEPPVVRNCPTQEFVAFAPVDGSQGLTLVSWIEPYATDNGPLVAIDKTHEPLSGFGPGRTEVTYTFADAARNVAHCTFSVMIYVGDWKLYDGEKPNIFNCPSTNVVIPLPIGRTESLVGWTEPWAIDNSGIIPTKQNNIGPRETFSLGRTRVQYVFTDEQDNSAMCAFDVILINSETPQNIIQNDWNIVNCPMSTIMANIPPNRKSVVVMWNEPTAVGRTGLSFTVNKTHTPGEGFPVGGTEVVYRFKASDGSIDECKFTIYISQMVDQANPAVIADRSQEPVIAGCPTNIDVTLPFGTEEAIVDWGEPQGYSPVQKAIRISKSHQPNSRFETNLRDPVSVEYMFTDSDGLSSTCSFSVVLKTGPMEFIIPDNDNTPPKIYDCPDDLEAELDYTNTATVSWIEPYATDNTGVTPRLKTNHRPYEEFLLGKTDVKYIFTDLSGNSAECSFIITVNEPTCKYNGLSYESFDPTIFVNQCSECLCVVANWYCRKACDLKCPLVYPSDIGICNEFGGPRSPQTFCNSDADCPESGSKCCAHICGGGRYCTKPESSSCYIRDMEYKAGQILRTIESGEAYECNCSLGEFHCKETKSCMHNNRQYFLGESRNSDDGCNNCTCSDSNSADGDWVCGETECETRTCTYIDQEYSIGDTRPAEDGCNTCTCSENSWSCTEIICEPRSCIYNGRNYLPGESRTADDNCNTCTCLESGWSCTQLLGCGGFSGRARASSSSSGASCLYDDVTYPSGATMTIDGCANCQCNDATLSCTPSATCPIGRKRRSTRNLVENIRMKSIENRRRNKASRRK